MELPPRDQDDSRDRQDNSTNARNARERATAQLCSWDNQFKQYRNDMMVGRMVARAQAAEWGELNRTGDRDTQEIALYMEQFTVSLAALFDQTVQRMHTMSAEAKTGVEDIGQ